ncbi:MAG: crossover junction endodeoxyribonuclease RuvC [Candidatus Anammoximicrobium sp.]|nr:crossover junction endodeoxyribonuclease RuvC [Candidatus Anammoximicrobium sp.]
MDCDERHDLVLGIDPGLNITGYGLVQLGAGSPKLVEAGVVRSRPHAPLEAKLIEVHRGVTELLTSFHPTVMAIEELYSHYERPTTAILMGHARGVICLAAAQAGVPIRHYAATHVKKVLTGSGRAPKLQVQMAICREFGLPQTPEPPDVADALAIALCHVYFRDVPLSRL